MRYTRLFVYRPRSLMLALALKAAWKNLRVPKVAGAMVAITGYRAPGDRNASLTFRNGLIMTVSGAVENLLREFFSRKLTSNVPAFANGKP